MYLLSWLSLLLQISFVTLAIAAALYYLAEMIEEYTATTKQIMKILITISCVINVGLWIFEGFPLTMIGVGLFTNIIEFGLLKSFPYIELSSPHFICTVVLVFVNHYFAFNFFSEVYFPINEVLTYFVICLWVIPFTFFISLSASDNVLPSHMHSSPMQGMYGSQDNDVLSHYMTKGKKKRSFLLSMFEGCKDLVNPSRSKRF